MPQSSFSVATAVVIFLTLTAALLLLTFTWAWSNHRPLPANGTCWAAPRCPTGTAAPGWPMNVESPFASVEPL